MLNSRVVSPLIATAQIHFLFNSSVYDQIDSVAMDSPLSSILANPFMRHHKKSWLENFEESEILFDRRYLDDTFCLFSSEQDAVLFSNYINSKHPNIIKFTTEKEVDHKILFLDVLVKNSSSRSPVTSVYSKKTFTGLLTNYFSFMSYSCKLGIIRTRG